jgi:3-hydroxybutyrate dehydrogenase
MQTVRLPQSELEKALAGRPKHVFLSGASRGIGEAIARLMGEEKHNFTLASRSYNKLMGLAMDLGTERAQAVKLDLADDRSIDEAVIAAESRFGPIDVLILNAGINLPTPLEDLSAEGRARFRKVVDVNLIGTFYLAQLATAHMPKGGRVLFIGSVLGRFGAPGTAAYSATKHATIGLVRTMALELAPRSIRVNVLNPGWVDTQMAHESLARMAESTGQNLQQATQAALNQLPIRRMIKPSEVASYVKFLVGPGGDAITGQGIDLSCGAVMV